MQRIGPDEFFLGTMNPAFLPAFRAVYSELYREFMDGLYRTEGNDEGTLSVIATGALNSDDARNMDILYRAFHAGAEAAQDLEPKR
jgi:hypothetical protein